MVFQPIVVERSSLNKEASLPLVDCPIFNIFTIQYALPYLLPTTLLRSAVIKALRIFRQFRGIHCKVSYCSELYNIWEILQLV